MLKPLYLSKLGEVQLPEYLKEGSSIAISKATIWVEWHNIWVTAWMIIVRDQKLPDDNPTYMYFRSGLYTLKNIQAIINGRSNKGAYLDLLPNGDIHLQIAKGNKLTMNDKGLQELLDIYTPKNDKYLLAGDHFGKPQICMFKTLRLYCNEVEDKNNLVKGAKSKVLQHLELKECDYTLGMPISYHYDTPYFIALAAPTDRLHFKLKDEFGNTVDTRGVRLELLIKP